MKSLFVLLVVLVAVSYCQSPWTGEWTDNSGLGVSQFICANNAALTFSAIYSEAGFLIGNLTSDFRSVHGNFYEAGLGDCTWGTFSFYLAPDSKSFSGSYTCGDATTTEIPVFETRINSDTPTSDECGAFTLVAQVPDGHYTSAVNSKHIYDICTSGSSVEMSFEYPVIVTTTSVLDAAIAAGVPLDPQEHGYAYGNVYENGNVMKLFSVDSAGHKYAFLAVRSGRNYNFFGYCARNEFGRAQFEDYDSPCQLTETLIRTGASSGAAQSCTRNVNLKLQLSSSQIVLEPKSSSSFAIPVTSISTFSLMMVLMFVALMSF